jgi:hypothetical protein
VRKLDQQVKELGPFHHLWLAEYHNAAVGAAYIKVAPTRDPGARTHPREGWEDALPIYVAAGLALEGLLWELHEVCGELSWWKKP